MPRFGGPAATVVASQLSCSDCRRRPSQAQQMWWPIGRAVVRGCCSAEPAALAARTLAGAQLTREVTGALDTGEEVLTGNSIAGGLEGAGVVLDARGGLAGRRAVGEREKGREKRMKSGG